MSAAITTAQCRVCICALEATTVSYDMQQLPLLAHKFVSCTSLCVSQKMVPLDGEEERQAVELEQLPSELCQVCVAQLEQLYAFRVKCIAADVHWRKELATRKNAGNGGELLVEEGEHDQSGQSSRVEQQVGDVCQQQQTKLCRMSRLSQAKPPKLTPLSFKCDICDARFLVEHRLLAHKRQHDGLMPYPCSVAGCERGFNRLHCLAEHLEQHAGTGSWFSCEQEGCQKRYRHKPTLMMHKRRCHKLGPELKSHICEFCGKVFNSTAVLKDHRYTHRDKSELPHGCPKEQCVRRFASKEKLKVHLLRHAGIKNFSCPYCGMRKTTRNELKIHMNYHTLERTWPCRFCTKVCNSSGNLKMHVRTVHERARDYACSYCERRFAKPDTRKYHEMTHTGEKPHVCGECGKRFTQPAALRTHRKIHERKSSETESTKMLTGPSANQMLTVSSETVMLSAASETVMLSAGAVAVMTGDVIPNA